MNFLIDCKAFFGFQQAKPKDGFYSSVDIYRFSLFINVFSLIPKQFPLIYILKNKRAAKFRFLTLPVLRVDNFRNDSLNL